MIFMNDKEILNKILLLKDIKPRKEWVLLTKQSMLGIETNLSYPLFLRIFDLSYLKRPVFVFASLALVIIIGVGLQLQGGFSKNVSVNNEQELRVELAQKKLEQLKIAIKEFQETSSRVSNDFAQLVENQPQKALQASRMIVQLQKDKSQLEKVLGSTIGQDQNDETKIENATKTLLENEFADLSTRTLNEDQLHILQEAKDAFEAKDYQTSLEKIWILSNVQ